MKVRIEIAPDYATPFAVIYTDAVTPEIQKTVELLESSGGPLVAQQGERLTVLRPEDVYLVRVEDGDTVIYTKDARHYSRQRLYEVLSQLGPGFLQISKQAAVSLERLKSVEAGLGGGLLLKLENGLDDYVSRRYLPGLKKYLGL
ncbi:MAG: LytTR family transcriptional regulator [Firmicutes bacterium]|nr:LytTR family transcriptional regulator [Bacillota bacterium]